MNVRKVPIEKVVPWEKNPRTITAEDLERLKRQIKRLGDYKPLVCVEERGRFVVLGGNMRLRAYKELGRRSVEVSIVKARTDAERLAYALSDNDRAGAYDEDALERVAGAAAGELDFTDFKVDLGAAVALSDVLGGGAAEGGGAGGAEKEIEISPEVMESHNYVVLYFDNEVDWLAAQQVFELKTVRGVDTLGQTGVGRVVRGADVLKRLTTK